LPTSAIAAHPARGLLMGNRGCLHDAEGRLGQARWRHRHWIVCLTVFKDRKRPLVSAGRYTELFFLDEAVALAAGHRPCAECRRAAYRAFREAWAAASLPGRSANEIDQVLHASRVGPYRTQVTHSAEIADLPDGTYVAGPDTPQLVLGPHLVPFAPGGYGRPCPRPKSGRATVLTPIATVAVLRSGYCPLFHPTVRPAPA
jgi:hypothetical protein